MAITSSYPIAVPTITDTLVGTKFIENKEPTTNSFNIGDIVELAAETIGAGTISIGTANGLSLAGTVLSLGLASSSANGALSSANWTTFNNKQAALNGTGFVKASGSSIFYDNSTYALDSAVVHNTGDEGVGGVKSFSGTIRANGGINPGEYAIEIDKSFEGEAIRVISTGATTFTLSLNGVATAASFVKTGGTSSQYLMADGSVTTGGGSGIAWLESNATDLTVWNNGKGNITTNTSFGDGALAANTSGTNNTCYGNNAGYFTTTGGDNTFIGRQAGQNNTTGVQNTSLGYGAGGYITTGSQNTSLGSQSGGSVVTGSANLFVGRGAGYTANGASSGNVVIGTNAGQTNPGEYNNKLYIANASGTPLIGGDFSAKTVTIDGSIAATKFILPSNAPTSSTDTGIAGEIRYDSTFIYICVATNSWKRVGMTAW